MKQIFLIMATVLVGQSVVANEKLIADPTIEKAVRDLLRKPEGELTKVDFEKFTVFGIGLPITDEGLKDVAKLKKLEELHLSRTMITDAGLREVAKLQNLTILILHGTKITDAGLKEVAKLQKLEGLNLISTQITDAGLREVAKLQRTHHS